MCVLSAVEETKECHRIFFQLKLVGLYTGGIDYDDIPWASASCFLIILLAKFFVLITRMWEH